MDGEIMNIGKELIIAGLKYKIELEKNLARDANALGTHCGNIATIKVDEDLRGCVKKKTLLHEILEAINFEYELKLEHNILCIIESALFEIINNKDNEWLLDYIKGDKDE